MSADLIEIVWDTETTGFKPDEGHRLVEIGAIRVKNKIPMTGDENVFHVYINPERDIPEESTKVHGITNEQVANCPTFPEIADQFLDFIGDSPLVAHNAAFDMNFINYQLKDIGKAEVSNEVVDSLKIARKMFPGARASLDALCSRFEIDNTSRTFHGALLDSELLAEVYLNLCGGRQQGLSLGDESGEGQIKAYALDTLQGDFIEPRTFEVSNDEKETHAAFIGKMKNSFWLPKSEESE